ncbi:MAG: branched-chain amino acid transport system substrate-binding protein [Gaiellaceae bacterium]|nr:branched-chain amino acid transport system substrate-binding protein [Gaiellaceae bacterium]
MRRVSLAGAAIIGVLLLAIPSAFARADLAAADPGISAKTVVIGGTFPLTGPASSYAPIPAGMKAYFSYINARRGPDKKRGIGGRQVVFKYYDDGYNPVNSVQLQRRLVEQDKVFAVVGTLGTEVNQAVQPYLNQQKVPHILVSTGASDFGKDFQKYPWTIGWQPDYVAEGRLYGTDIRNNHKDAKIAILYQSDSYGRDYVAGFKSALGTANVKRQVVGEEGYDVLGGGTPQSQLVKLRGSGADTLMIFVTPTPTVQTYAIIRALNWKPANIYVNSVSATDTFMGAAVARSSAATVNGSISSQYLKDPASPVWADDATVKLYKSVMAKYAPSANASNGLYFYGFAKGDTFVRAMYKAGASPTRASLMRALLSLNETSPYLLPGSKLKTSATDHFIISHQRLMTYTAPLWTGTGALIDGRPRG